MKTVAITALRFIVILGVTCLVMGSGVAMLYSVFKDRLAEREAIQFQELLGQILPPGEAVLIAGSQENGDDVYLVADDQGQPLAYAARGEATGYSSKVKILLGASADDELSIRRVAVLSQAETPGLGTKVAESRSNYTLWQKIGLAEADGPEEQYNDFMDQFSAERREAKAQPPLTVEQLNTVDAITAATISSNAIKDGVRQAAERIRAAREAARSRAAGSAAVLE